MGVIKLQKYRIKSRYGNILLIYGRGPMAISREVEKSGEVCTVDDAREFIEAFLNQFPKVRELIDDAHRQVEDNGYIEGAWGRRANFYRTGTHTDESALARQKRQAVNFLPQNYVADLLRKALINLFQYRRDHAHEVTFDVVLTVYDSALFEVPARYAEHLVDVVIPECMVANAYTDTCPFTVAVDTDVSRCWDEQLYIDELLDYGVSMEFARRFSVKHEDKDGNVSYPEKGV